VFTYYFRCHATTFLLFALIVLNSLRWSDVGGPNSVYGPMAVGVVAALLALNLSVDHRSGMAFAVPIALVCLSMIVNASNLGPANFRSGVSTILALGLFMVKPLTLSRERFRTMIAVYVIAMLGLSIWTYLVHPPPPGDSNANFNGNPNGAAMFFLLWTLLGLTFLSGATRWVVTSLLALLILTTSSRNGLLAFTFAVVGYGLVGNRINLPGTALWTALTQRLDRRRRAGLLLLLVLMVVAGSTVLPLTFSRLRNLQTGRTRLWSAALTESASSPRAVLFGEGPAMTGKLIQRRILEARGSHSSYVEAIGSMGYPFLMATLAALGVWSASLYRAGHRQILWLLVPILGYGSTESTLFTGITPLWSGLALLGVWLRSRDVADMHSPVRPHLGHAPVSSVQLPQPTVPTHRPSWGDTGSVPAPSTRLHVR